MSLVKSKAIQLGFDATPTNNFLIYQPLTPDGTFRIANGNQGATTDIMTVTSGGSVTFAGTTNFSSLNFGSGSESAPSLFPTGDSNTGIWFPAADTFAVSTGGTQRLRITSTGNVGIGTTAPGVKLELASSSDTTLRIGRTSGASMDVFTTASAGFVSVTTNSNLVLRTNNTDRILIDTSGSVGIGVASTDGYQLKIATPLNTSITNKLLSLSPSQLDPTIYDLSWQSTFTGAGSNAGFRYDLVQRDFYAGTNTYLSLKGGNVGINTTSPSVRLHVYDTADSNIQAESNGNGAYLILNTHATTNKDYKALIGKSGGTFKWGIGNYGNSDDTAISFYTNGANERLRITGAGNVGIGINNPSVNTNATVLHLHSSTSNYGAIAHFTNAASGSAANSGLIVGKWSDNTNYLFDYGANPVIIGTNSSSRIYVAADGKVGIGMTTPSYLLQVNGSIYADNYGCVYYTNMSGGPNGIPNYGGIYTFDAYGGPVPNFPTNSWNVSVFHAGTSARGLQIGTGYSDGAVYWRTGNETWTSWTAFANQSSSDYRLKTNITPMTEAWSILDQLPVYSFNWKKDPSGAKVVGFLAHEAQQIIPDSVNLPKDAVDADGNPSYQSVDLAKFVPLLAAALKELKQQFDEYVASHP